MRLRNMVAEISWAGHQVPHLIDLGWTLGDWVTSPDLGRESRSHIMALEQKDKIDFQFPTLPIFQLLYPLFLFGRTKTLLSGRRVKARDCTMYHCKLAFDNSLLAHLDWLDIVILCMLKAYLDLPSYDWYVLDFQDGWFLVISHWELIVKRFFCLMVK